MTDVADDELFALLDAYTHAVQAGDAARAAGLLEAHPAAASMMRCVAAVEGLNGPSAPLTAASTSADVFPRRFGRFELLREVGRGGMGVVYAARQPELGRTVAVKMILASHLASTEEVRRFYREASAAGRIRHRHIVAIHEVGAEQGQPFFSMDFVAGPSLAERLAAGPWGPEQAARCLTTIARAVAFLHQHGVLHRDLKPGNILIDGEGEPVVTDFGLAKVFDDDGRTRTGAVLGSPSYMSPEQAAGKTAEIGPASDVYGLGAILYEMLTGRPPFREATPFETLLRVMEGEPLPPRGLRSDLPRDLEAICLKCLERDRTRRYRQAEEVAADLERFLRNEPLPLTPASWRDAARRGWRRYPALVARMAMFCVTAAVVVAGAIAEPEHLAASLRTLSTLGLWACVAIGFQVLARQPRAAVTSRYGWLAADVGFLTWLVAHAAPPHGMLGVIYAVLIAASGLFVQVRLVAFTTVLCLAAFSLVSAGVPDPDTPWRYPWIVAGALALLGAIVAYQVYRITLLDRFFRDGRRE